MYHQMSVGVKGVSTSGPSVSDVNQQVEQAKELMLRTLEFAFYKQQDMNLKLVRIAGELFQGKNFDVTV